MIKIERGNLSSIAQRHYERVVPDQSKKRRGLYSKLVEKINFETGERQRFCQELLALLGNDHTDSLITMLPQRLQEVADDLELRFAAVMGDNAFMKALFSVFFYDKYDKWGAYKLAEDLSISVCPYCNRQYTFTIVGATGKTRPEFDHFLDKARYPMFALCFYNLVPSCHICNSNLKNTKRFSLRTHLHPYLKGFSDEISFSLSVKNVGFINGKASAYDVIFLTRHGTDPDLDTKARANIQDFCLQEIYNRHKDYIDEIIKKLISYDKTYVEMLYRKYAGSLFSDEQQVREIIMGNYLTIDGHEKRPLSKLTMDITRELGGLF